MEKYLKAVEKRKKEMHAYIDAFAFPVSGWKTRPDYFEEKVEKAIEEFSNITSGIRAVAIFDYDVDGECFRKLTGKLEAEIATFRGFCENRIKEVRDSYDA